jgi:hypothetical protein
MTRVLIPGRRAYDDGIACPLPECVGGCHQGRAPCDCLLGDTKLATTIPPRSWVPVRPAITVHRIPLRRRVRRFLGRFWAFLTQPTFRG